MGEKEGGAMIDQGYFADKLNDERQRAVKTLGWADNELKSHDMSIQEAMPDSADDEIADSATETLTMELDASYQRRATSRLNAIDSALQRIRLGQFGTCVNCGKEISRARLEAIPWTPYCRDCAQELEVLD
ncbi:RNA polymerase-binding transcription factor [compost metagenome]